MANNTIPTPAPRSSAHPEARRRALAARWSLRAISLLIILIVTGVIFYNTHKPLPAGLSYEGTVHQVESVDFLYDLTYKQGDRVVREQQILERILSSIDQARQFVVIDMFLFNSYMNEGQSFPQITQQLTDKLIAQKQKHPALQAVFITDEVNTSYGSHTTPQLEQLKRAGIQVVITDTDALRDSTPLYSGLWRTFFRWFGESGRGWIPNPMADTAPDVTARSYLKLFNVKANHRKVIATEQQLIISSGNVHDASAHHSNTAFALGGEIIADALATEQAAVRLSGNLQLPVRGPQPAAEKGDIGVRLLTEGRVFARLLEALQQAGQGDTLWMGMFYLAEPKILEELKGAAERGAVIRLILDPNQNAFGSDKIGIPNRPVAEELVDSSQGKIGVRWYNTSEEQYHTKMMMITGSRGSTIFSGSSNFTTRNLDDLNLETDLMIQTPAGHPLSVEVQSYFERLWSNQDGEYTLDYEAYKEKTYPLKKIVYLLQDILGFTTF